MTIINVGDEASKRFKFLCPSDMKPKEFLMMLLDKHEAELKGQRIPEDYWKAFRDNIQQAIIDAAEYLFKREDDIENPEDEYKPEEKKEVPSDDLVIK